MRHASLSLPETLRHQYARGQWDLLLCSDMLDLAAFLGHARHLIGNLPTVVYFHENQLTYPVRHEDERDLHFAVTNLTTAYAADSVWFNSAFHRDEFLGAADDLVRRLPAGLPDNLIPAIRGKTAVEPPGIDSIVPLEARSPGPLRILWAARWEFDKRPEDFFSALEILAERRVDFRLNVVGEQFRDVPPVFEKARNRFARRIERWGYQESRQEYIRCLQESDVVVSTAIHEFFGLSVIEAMAAGSQPLLPHRLSYPELLAPLGDSSAPFFYDGTVTDLANKLQNLATHLDRDTRVYPQTPMVVQRYFWNQRAEEMDRRLEQIGSNRSP